MGRISVPQLPVATGGPPPIALLADAVNRFTSLLDKGKGKTLVLTGAGVSVDSGIRAYRGERGSYSINKTYRPIFYNEFVSSETFRQRYWARSYLGYTPVQHAEPNIGHYALAALMRLGAVDELITQNVDRLHHRATSMGDDPRLSRPDPFQPHPHILELHGTLKFVHCINCNHMLERDSFQETLSRLNPSWAEYASEMARKGTEPRTNPDGDVDLQNRSYETFEVPPCPNCSTGALKPTVTFFGESLTPAVRAKSHNLVAKASNVVVVGSALATYSAFRLIREATDQGKEVGVVNLGVTRADPLVSWKVGCSRDEDVPRAAAAGLGSSEVLRAVGKDLVSRQRREKGGVEEIVELMLRSGIKRPVDDYTEREPAS